MNSCVYPMLTRGLAWLVQEQQISVQDIQTRIPSLSDALADVAHADAECRGANIDENDYTVFTYQDLEFELELLSQSVTKKLAFIDNQVRTTAREPLFRCLSAEFWARRSFLVI